MSAVTNTAIKTKKAYSATKELYSWYPGMNLKEVTRNELKDTVDHLLLGSPTVDISNLDCRISGALDYSHPLSEENFV